MYLIAPVLFVGDYDEIMELLPVLRATSLKEGGNIAPLFEGGVSEADGGECRNIFDYPRLCRNSQPASGKVTEATASIGTKFHAMAERPQPSRYTRHTESRAKRSGSA